MVLKSVKIAGDLNHKDKIVIMDLKENEDLKEVILKKYPYAISYKVIN